MLTDAPCSAPELAEGEPFNGGTLVRQYPVADRPGRYPSRIVLVNLGNEYATWVAVWPADRPEPKWYCVWGHYLSLSDSNSAHDDFEFRSARGF